VLAAALAALAVTIHDGRPMLGVLGVFLGCWVILGALSELWLRLGAGAGRLQRLRRLPRADLGKAAAHAGLGVVILAVSVVQSWSVEKVLVLAPGEGFDLGAYHVVLGRVDEVRGPNYVSTMAEMVVTRAGNEVARLYPEKRVYPVQGMPTTEAAIHQGPWRDIYLVIGDAQPDGSWAVRAYLKPLAGWLWAGAALMALGGALSLSDRRLRVAAGASRAAPPRAVAAE